MIFCPECGEENPQGSKFCRKCGVNLVHEHEIPKKEEPPKKATVISNTQNNQKQHTTVNTTTTSTKKKDDDNLWCLGCCICMFFLFIISLSLFI